MPMFVFLWDLGATDSSSWIALIASMTFVIHQGMGLNMRLTYVSQRIMGLRFPIPSAPMLFMFLNERLIISWAPGVDFLYFEEVVSLSLLLH